MGDGHLSFCKICVRKRVTEERNQNIEKHRLRDAIRYYASEERKAQAHKSSRTEKGKEKHKIVCRIHNEKYPDKYKARNAVNNAVRDGRLVKKPCEVCGSAKSQGHHEDYSKPLDARWLCSKHHMEKHRQHLLAVKLAEKKMTKIAKQEQKKAA